MNLTTYAGLGGIGFVVLALAIDAIYRRAGLPIPTSGQSLDAVAEAFARGVAALKRASVVAPTLWLCTMLFAAGLLPVLRRGGSESGYASPRVLFLSASTSPFNAADTSRFVLGGLIGWRGWITWIVAYSVVLLRL